MKASDRELLSRYGHALGQQTYLSDLSLCSIRFRKNHEPHVGTELDAAMVKVFEAHARRVAGESSPADCDRALAEAVG